MQKIDGPRLKPASGGTPKQLVIFLHGYGADGNDLLSLGQYWRNELPDAAFVSPHAPQPCDANPYGGRQWFALTFRDPDERWTGANEAGPILDAFIDEELKALGLTDSALALVGFSQGTMMAMHVSFRRPRAMAAVVGFSGMVAGSGHLAADVVSRPPVLLLHGDSDEVIPVEALQEARSVLGQAQIPVEWHVAQGLGHGIDERELNIAGQFLRRAFGG
jgi:phospholipase/carboxylesterase